MDTIAVIINTGSGSEAATAKLEQLRAAFAGLEIQPEYFLAHDGESLRIAVENAVAQGFRRIVAAGGDGTVSAVASFLAGTENILGILPTGTLNHLAKDLNIPLTLADAARIAAYGSTRAMDVGCVNDKYFLNNSSIGMYPKLVRFREAQQLLGRGKWFAFFLSFFALFKKYSTMQVRLQFAGADISVATPFVFIGNNEYTIEGFNFGSRSCVDAGHLSVYVVRHPGRWGLIMLALHALHGTLRSHRDFDCYQVESLSIDIADNRKRRLGLRRTSSRKKSAHVALDGEVQSLVAPLEYKIIPRALHVAVPEE